MVVARADSPTPFLSPKVYHLDVTRATRALARNGGNGFALRIVPNRAVDDGWTVRFTPRADAPPILVIKVLADDDEQAAPQQADDNSPLRARACRGTHTGHPISAPRQWSGRGRALARH